MISMATLKSMEEDKRLKQHFSELLQAKDMFSQKHATKEVGEIFFTPRQLAVQKSTTTTATVAMTVDTPPAKSMDFCKAVTAKIEDPSFVNKHKNSCAPLAMLAFASVVVEHIIRGKAFDMFDCFHGITTPSSKEEHMSPHHHLIVGQQLLNVDWKKMLGVEVNCPRCPARMLANDRTNFSKNEILFPVCDLDSPPQWCMQ